MRSSQSQFKYYCKLLALGEAEQYDSFVQASVTRPLSPLFRDLAVGLGQQMFFWGKDVVHPEGNLFVRTGFEKDSEAGNQGASCYRLPWQGGSIELHGSFAGWLGSGGGFFFVRPLGRCVRWLDSTPPVPDQWPREHYASKADETLYSPARPCLNWWLDHEAEVTRLTGSDYREACFQHYKKLPRSRAWLSPDLAIRWVTGLRDDPEDLPRARRFAEKMNS